MVYISAVNIPGCVVLLIREAGSSSQLEYTWTDITRQMHSIVGQALPCKHCMRNSYGNNQRQVTAILTAAHTSQPLFPVLCSFFCSLLLRTFWLQSETAAHTSQQGSQNATCIEFLEVQLYYIAYIVGT